MNELLNSIANFSPEQLEYLKLQLEKLNKGTQTPAQTHITPRKRESNVFPLSLAQQGYWFHEQLNPTKTNANITAAMRVGGALDVAALERALQECVRRHEILRTAFKVVDERPAQVVSTTSALSLKLMDLSGLPAHEREEQALRLASEEPQHRFALEEGTLLRAAVIRLHAEEHILLLTIHHIICDRWAHSVFVRELLTLYTAFTRGAPSPLPEPRIQYADFALWQHEWLQGEEMQTQLAYWKQQLEGTPPSLNLPTTQTRALHRHAESSKHYLLFPKELTARLKAFAQREETTLFVTLLAAFKVLLYRLTNQEDIVVGSIIANRSRPELENAIGLFANTIPIRSKFSAEMSFRQALRGVFETTLDAHANQDLPFERLVQELQPDRETGRPPLFDVVFNLQKAPPSDVALPGLTLNPLNVSKELAGFDLFWLLEESEQGLTGVLEYNADLFEDSTIEQIVEAYLRVLQTAVEQAELPLSRFPLPAELETKARAARLRGQRQTLRLTATFTADPVEEVLAFWMQELDTPAQIEIAPYNQVFQQLLDPASLLLTNKRGVNIVLLRLDDWLRYRADEESRAGSNSSTATEEEEGIERNMQEFFAAMSSAVERSAVPYILCLCPISPAALTDARRAAFFSRAEERLFSELAGVSGLHLITSAETADLYPVREYFDEVRDRLGHVSYTPEFFAALGTNLARKIHAIQSRPSKVIVIDADETLWKGVCAEDGVAGIEIDAPRRALQEFLSTCHESGMLLCLCSKNDERDVEEVFEQRADMVLKREQIVAWRVNWAAKSDNIRALSQELDLGLDSFVFLDDNPLECAEVSAHCPQALTLQLPPDAESIPRFVKHIWALDVLKTTEEDKQRTTSYRQKRERELFHQESISFEDFISGLDLQVKISGTTPQEVARAAQLTQRTTQFNNTSLTRSETEIQSFLRSGERACLSVTAKDRFGEYGIIGIMICAARESALEVELLLSCRVLGRGVEHRMIAELGRKAREKGLTQVSIACVRTSRNQPVRDFLESIAAAFGRPFDGGVLYQIPVEIAESLKFQPGLTMQPERAAVLSDAIHAASPDEEESTPPSQLKSALVQRIATELSDVGQILGLLESRALGARAKQETVYAPPRTPIEEMLANLWASTLKLDKVGINDNFFKSGGHSLLGTLLISRIRDTFQVELPLLSLFDAPTVAGLAEIIEQQLLGQVDANELSEMIQGLDQLTDEEVKSLLLDEAAQLEHDGAAE